MAAWCLRAVRRLSSGHRSDQGSLSRLARRPEARRWTRPEIPHRVREVGDLLVAVRDVSDHGQGEPIALNTLATGHEPAAKTGVGG
jgi:hypothetical protein